MKTIETPRTYGDVITINVDVQNDFALRTGALSVRDGEAVIEPLNNLNGMTRENGGQVIFTQDYHPAETAHFEINGGIWPVHCVQGTEGAELHEALAQEPSDLIVHKGMSLVDDGYSGFEGTIVNGELAGTGLTEFVAAREQQAKERRSRIAIIIGGLATDFCDQATTLDALAVTDRETTDVIIATDSMRAVDLQPGDGDTAIAAMREAGALAMTTEEIINGGIVIDETRLER